MMEKVKDLRIIEKLVDGKWVKTRMKELKVNDFFRIFEADGTPVPFGQDFPNEFEFIVVDKPFFSNSVGRWQCSMAISPYVIIQRYGGWDRLDKFLEENPHYEYFRGVFELALQNK